MDYRPRTTSRGDADTVGPGACAREQPPATGQAKGTVQEKGESQKMVKNKEAIKQYAAGGGPKAVVGLLAFHNEKIRQFQAMTNDQVMQSDEDRISTAFTWFTDPHSTVAQALNLLDKIPPLVLPVDERRPEFESLVVERKYKAKIHVHLSSSRIAIQGEEVNEKITDDFHLLQNLLPAVDIAQAVHGASLAASPAYSQSRATGDLIVYADGKREPGFISVVIEDKTASVFSKHKSKFMELITHRPFPFPPRNEMESAPSEMRIWIQIWGQMLTYHAYFAKVFSPIGVLYIRRELNSNELVASRLYDNLDGELWTGTRGVYIVQHGHSTFLPDISVDIGCQCTTPASPTPFTKQLGRGASGIMLNSLAGSRVIKLFQDRNLAFHEANVLRRAQGVPNIPSLHGVVSNGDRIGVMSSYAGAPIGNLATLTLVQNRRLMLPLDINCLKQ
ncbi:hypothetical protein GGX14DRAFT_393406 [Mycena pura]|uniref:Uncharacterized protein n=1 Tax=Mycena pura TaxID=153505 RepID=A0AAD6VKI5_9AGAR|nr:hypothetical protein GGX14DRAFT_393406 [Mycena pura]